jgi:uncharacterized delta-60 repeat protein
MGHRSRAAQARPLGFVVLVCLMLGLVPAAGMAAAGALDLSFGAGGKTTIQFGGSDDAWGMAEQPDGKAVLVGQTAKDASSPADCAVARLNPNGSPDSSFGAAGRATVDFGGDDACFSAALQSDGKLVVAGKTTASGVDQWAVARLNSDGSPDPTFGTAGKSVITFGATGGRAVSVLVQPDGRIVVIGSSSTTATQSDFTAVRLTSSGAIDTSFGTGGHTVVDFGGDDHVEAAALQPDGRIILAGDSTAGMGGHNFAAARLNSDGSVDPSFGMAGKVVLDFGGDDGADAVAVQPDGKMLLAGNTTAGAGGGDFALARLSSNGSLDPSFGAGGKVTVDFGGADIAFGMALQPDGSVVLAGGTTTTTDVGQFAIARVTSAGALDSAFGQGGKTTIAFGGVSTGRAVALQTDGNIVVGGVSEGSQFVVARLLGAGPGGPGGGGGDGGGGGIVPPPNAPQCHGGLVLALVRGQWRCARVSGIDDGLLPGVADLPGYRSAGGGSSVARAALGDSVTRVMRGTPGQGAAFRAGSRGLSVGVFVFSSSGRAAAGLHALSHGRRRVALARGLSGLLRVRSTRNTTDLSVVFRVAKAVGAVRLRAKGRVAGASPAVVAYAKEVAARLQRVLSLTAWQRTVDGIGPDGSISPKLALQAFTISYGPLPGVRVPAGPGAGPPDGTVAMEMVAGVWNRLTAAQHDAIDRYLGAPHDASSRLAHRAAEPALTPSPVYQAMADDYNGIYRTKLPSAPPVTVKVFTVNEPLGEGGKDLMNALPVNARGEYGNGPPAYCRVRVAPLGQNHLDTDRLMAHEVFHCYMFVLTSKWPALSLWIKEGMAEWAAGFVTGRDSLGWLASYMSTPTKPLFSRTYDGIGFWGRADEAGVRGSLWAKIPGILNTGSNEAAFAMAGGTAASFVDTWASAAFRFSGAGQAWHQTDPVSLAADHPTLPFDQLTSSADLASQPYALHEYSVLEDPNAPLVNVVGLAGTVRAGTTRSDFGPVLNDWFCYGKCECPPDEDSSGIPQHHTLSSALFLALTGGESAGDGQVIYHSLDEYCKAKPNQPTGGGGGGGGSGGPGLQIRALTGDSPIIGTITSGSCSFAGGGFKAVGSGSGYRFAMRIAGAKRPGQYIIPNNNTATYVNVSRGGATYSTVGRNTEVLGTTGPRNAGAAVIRTRRVRVGKRTVVRYQIAVGIDDLVIGGHPGVALIPGPGGLKC